MLRVQFGVRYLGQGHFICGCRLKGTHRSFIASPHTFPVGPENPTGEPLVTNPLSYPLGHGCWEACGESAQNLLLHVIHPDP